MHNYLIGDSEYLIFNLYSYLCSAMKNLVIIITLLVSLCCCTIEADRNRMRSGHDSINQRKRNDQPFTIMLRDNNCQDIFDDHEKR